MPVSPTPPKAGSSGLLSCRRRPARRVARVLATFLMVASIMAAIGTATPAAAEPVRLDVSEAVSGIDERSGRAVVDFILTTAGREAFARFTTAHVGRRIDIRVDGRTLLRPVVSEPVHGGVGRIPVDSLDDGRVLARRLGREGARLEVEAVAE